MNKNIAAVIEIKFVCFPLVCVCVYNKILIRIMMANDKQRSIANWKREVNYKWKK